MSLRIDLRDKRLRGGRLTLDARTNRERERAGRAAVLRLLLAQGEHALIEGLRTRQLDLVEVERASNQKDPAREAALRALRTRVSGEGGPTLQQAVDRVLALPRRATTRANYDVVSRHLVEYFTPERRLAEILTVEADQYLSAPQKSMGGKPWGAARQQLARAFGSIVWRLAIEDEAERGEREGRPALVTRNIWKRAKGEPYRSGRVEFLRPAEWVAVREATRGRPVCALLALGCRAGLRAEEATHLRTGLDVDLEHRVIEVRGRKGEWAWEPKSKNSSRTVPIPDDLFEILTQHVESGYAGRTFFLHAPGYDRPLSSTAVIQWTRAAFEAVGIRYGRRKDALTFHSCRHTYCSWLTQLGMHPKKVARLAGDTPAEILRTYGHLAEDDHGEAVGLLNAIVAKEGL